MSKPQTDLSTRSDTATYRPSTRIKHPQRRPPPGNFFDRRCEVRLSPEIHLLLLLIAHVLGHKTVSSLIRSLVLALARQLRLINGLEPRPLPEFLARFGLSDDLPPEYRYTARERAIMRQDSMEKRVARWKRVGKNPMSYEDMLFENEQERRREHLAACRPKKPAKPAPVLVEEAPAPVLVEEAPAPVLVEEAPAPAPVEEIEERKFSPKVLELVTVALSCLPEYTLQRIQQEALTLTQEALEAQLETLLDLYRPAPLLPRKKLPWRDLS